MTRRTSAQREEERLSLRRIQSQPAFEKPDFEVEFNMESFNGKLATCLARAMEADQRRQTRLEKIKPIAQAMFLVQTDRLSALYEEVFSVAELEGRIATAQLDIAARRAMETAHTERRDLCPGPSGISVPTMESTILVNIPRGESDSVLPDMDREIDPPRSLPATQNNNQERQGDSWTPVNASSQLNGMPQCLISWDNTHYNRASPCIGDSFFSPAKASHPSAGRLAAAAEIPELEQRLLAQRAQTERVRARGADLASMAGATVFDHTGALTVFASLSSQENRKIRARHLTMHENPHINFLDENTVDITDGKADDGDKAKSGMEKARKSEGYRTIYSYFQPTFEHLRGFPPERVRFEMVNGLLHIDGVNIEHLPGFKFGMGYADEQISQRIIQGGERTASLVSRPGRNFSASQFNHFALQDMAYARERLWDTRNGIPERFYREGEGCDQSYNLKGNFQSHQRSRHRPVETHRCDECPKSFRRESHLERHQGIHGRQRREALRETILDHVSAQPQVTSEVAVSATAQCAAQTSRELPFWQSNSEIGQPQDTELITTAGEEHTGTKSAEDGPPDTDDENNNFGLRGGLLEVPRPLCMTAFLVQTLKYMSLPTIGLSYQIKQRDGRWRSIVAEILLHNCPPEGEKWTPFWLEWREHLPRGTERSSDPVKAVHASATTKKLKNFNLAETQPEICSLGFYADRKETFCAPDGHIFDGSSARDLVSTNSVKKPSNGIHQIDLDNDAENASLRGGAEEDQPTLNFAPEMPSISYLIQMLKNPHGSDASRPLHQRKIDELRFLNSVILNHNLNEDDARWKLFWIYWKDKWTTYSPADSWVLTTNEVVMATIAWLKRLKLKGRELDACIYGLYAATAITFSLVMGRIYDIASNPARANCSSSDGLVQYAPNGGDPANVNVGLRGGADETSASSGVSSMNLGGAQETIGPIFEALNYGKTLTHEDVETRVIVLKLARRASAESEGPSRSRFVGIREESGLRGGAGIYDPRVDLHEGAALPFHRRIGFIPSRKSLHEFMTIHERAFFSPGTLQRDEVVMNTGQCRAHLISISNKMSELRGGNIPDPEAMQCLAKTVEQHTVDGSNDTMNESNEYQHGSGSSFCSPHQLNHSSNNFILKSDLLHLRTFGLGIRKEMSTASLQQQKMNLSGIIKYDNTSCEFNSHDSTYCTSHGVYHHGHAAQPLSYYPHAQQPYGVSANSSLFFGRPIIQPRDSSTAWRSNIFSPANAAVALTDQAGMCYYPDPVNSQFCTRHHTIHSRVKSTRPSSCITPYALDETTLMAKARALKLGSPYALNKSTVMAQARPLTLGSQYAIQDTTSRTQARALTLGLVSNGVPDVAMLQHQAKAHAYHVFGQNSQLTHEMQPSARSHLWAAQGGSYFGRGLQQTLAPSRVASWGPHAAPNVGGECRGTAFTTSMGKMNDMILASSIEAGNSELEPSYCNRPAAMPSSTRKRQRTSHVKEEDGSGIDALALNQDARKRLKRETSARLELSQQPSTFVETPSSFVNQVVDCEMVDAPLSFNQLFENEWRLTKGRTDARDWATGISCDDRSDGLRGGQLDGDALDAHAHGSSNLPLRTAQHSIRQFTSCIRQVESGHSRIPAPVSPPDPPRHISSSTPHVATTGLNGTNDENHNPLVGRETAEPEEGTQLNTDGFNVSFELPPLTPDYPSTQRNVPWPAPALLSIDEALSTRHGREFVRRSRNAPPLSVLGRRQRSTSSSVSPISRPAPAIRDDSFSSVASAQVPGHAVTPSARTFVAPRQLFANPIRQPLNPPSHALLDHPFIRSANGAVQFQVPFQNTNPLQPPLQPRELSSPQVYPVLTPRPSTPPARQRIAWNDEDFFRGFLSDMEDPNIGPRVRDSHHLQEVQRAVTPPLRRRIPWDDEADSGGSLSDVENPEEFARQSRRFHRRRETLRQERARQEAALPLFSDLSSLPRPEMSGGLVLIEDDIWERNQRLAREAENAPLYLRSFVDALPTGIIGGIHGDRQAYIDSLMYSTAASGHVAGQRGGVPEGVWYNITFQRRLDSKPAPNRKRLTSRSNNHRYALDSENNFSGAESDEDGEYLVFSWDVQIPAAGMKDLLRSCGTEWGVKALRARDWALEEMALDAKSDGCTEAIGEWWEAVRGGASRDERCKGVGVIVLEP